MPESKSEIIESYNYLFQEVTTDVSGDNLSLNDLLLKLIILTRDINRPDIEKWARLEREGYHKDNPAYTEDIAKPEYRNVVYYYTDVAGKRSEFRAKENKILTLQWAVYNIESVSHYGHAYREDPDWIFGYGNIYLTIDQSMIKKILKSIHSRIIDKLLEIKPFIRDLEYNEKNQETKISINNLHPNVLNVAEQYCKVGNYRSAVLDTYIALILAVKEKSGRYDLDGVPLMSEVFSPEKGNISVSDDKEVQRGYMFLFMGAVGGIRNDMAHRLGTINALEATEWLAYASALFKVLDTCKLDKTHLETYKNLVEPPTGNI